MALLGLLALAALAAPTPLAARPVGPPVTAASADTVRGRVTDARGAPIAGARVELAELHAGVVTDTAGAFAFASVPAGRFTLVVRRPGYATELREVHAGGASLMIGLRESPVPIEAVTVTATRSAIAPLASPLPTAELGGEQLRREHGVSLSHALEHLPGVRALRTGEQVGKPVIRGLSGARVLVLESGNRLEDYSWSNEDAPSVDARLAERIEVIRGPASVLYGSDAIGGVVNVIPEELPDARGGRSVVRGGVELYGASNNAELGTALHAEGAARGLGWRLFTVGRRAADLHTPAGELPNTGFEAVNGEAMLGVRGVRGAATLRYARYGGEFKLLEANGPPPGREEEEEGPERKTSDDRVQLAATMPAGALRLESRAQWQRHSLIEMADAAEVGGAAGAGEREVEIFNLLLNTVTAELLAHHDVGARVRGTVGVSAMRQTNNSAGPLLLVPDATVSSGALFAFEQATLGRWSLLAGARADARRARADERQGRNGVPAARRFTATTADVGAVFRPAADVAVAANLGRAFRAPTLFELYTSGPLLSDARYVVGDPALRAEASWNADASVRWWRSAVRGEVAAFRNRIDHFIHLTPSDPPATSGQLPVFQYRAVDATLWGGEAALTIEPAAVLSVFGRTDFVRATENGTGEPLPLIPPLRTGVGAELHASHIAWAERLYLGADAEITARKTRLSPRESPAGAEGYTLYHLSVGIARRLFGWDARMDVRVRNLTDVRYRDFLSRYKEFALSPGRNAVVRIAVER